MTTEPQPKFSWVAELTHPELSDSLKEALRQVVDPEIGLSVIELGLVRDVVIQKDQAQINMIMTTPFCPYAPALLEMTRQKAESALGRPTTIDMSMDPWDPSMMEEQAARDWGFF
jgi:metal-sulfur cluster biosynthetic enzyme